LNWDNFLNDIVHTPAIVPDVEPGDITECLRCRKTAIRRKGNDAAQPFKYAEDQGYCPECVVTEWLRDGPLQEVVEMVIARDGLKPFLSEPIQRQFTALLETGNSDLKGLEVDWPRLVQIWELPFPKKTKRGKGKGKK
jgi:hypothetical protein